MDDLGNRKPNCILQEMWNLTPDADSQFFQALWLLRLPAQVRNIIAPYKHLPLDIQAEHADTSNYYATMAPQTEVNVKSPTEDVLKNRKRASHHQTYAGTITNMEIGH